ncbi:hypothetical protein TNCV_1992961 [Trichonephila clavipes]|nr:hypothetical protein TNCV_1992961 [Trichonephila clavipes]
MSRSDEAIRRCRQKWADKGKFQRHDDSGRLKATADWEDRLTVRPAVTVINHQTCNPRTSVHHDQPQTTDRAKFTLVLIATLPTTPACTLEPDYSGVCLNQVGIMLTGGRIEFREESRFQLCPDDHRRRV